MSYQQHIDDANEFLHIPCVERAVIECDDELKSIIGDNVTRAAIIASITKLVTAMISHSNLQHPASMPFMFGQS